MLIREEMHIFVLFTLAACTAVAVGPVMSQQPTIFDIIENEPDLSEVTISNVITDGFYKV